MRILLQRKESKKTKKTKKNVKKVKGKIEGFFVESIILDGQANFLCYDLFSDTISIKKQFEMDDRIIKPLEALECGYIPYEFTQSEIEKAIQKKINKEKLLDKIKRQIDKFVVVRDLDKYLILGDILLTYEQERINTVHYLFFVGETESGKSTAVHLFRWMGYRCLYGEDIPNADIYNFLGTDEEGAGTIAEDEAQEIEKNREKIRTYKNSYSKGSVKPRIITTNYSKTQVYYKTFCPKIFAGEKIPEDKGFKERLAVVNMLEGKPMSNIKRLTDEEKRELLSLRKALLIYKLQNIKTKLPDFNSGLEQRDQELWEDFLAVTFGTSYYEECKKTVAYYTNQRHEVIWNSLEAKLFKLVTRVLDPNLELGLENFWDFLTQTQDELPGSMEKETFYPHDFGTKITRNSLSSLFESKFQARRKQSYRIDPKGKKHKRSVYQFNPEVIDVLTKKYNISNEKLGRVVSGGGSGRSGEDDSKADHVDHVNHSKQVTLIPEKMWFCKSHNAGPFYMTERSQSSGNIHDLHKRIGCNIEYSNEEKK